MRLASKLVGAALVVAATLGACAPHELTTTGGYVIAPSVSADAGAVIDAGGLDGGR
jgi:hypothetical protein